ncbi:hypothetical protein [Chryseobacterium indologenes]|uniref:hypothetical protein n=1 Tax=Chryseobacterium indologenes TaxID=253 RepID=UPI0016264FE0|nr:hypothetical protein [Chryseobacterium indologenes]
MVKKILALTILCYLFNGCVSGQKLGDGTKVPEKGYKFKNKEKFNSEIYRTIDLNYFYELEYSYYSDLNFGEKGEAWPEKWVKILQFYPKGQVREYAHKFSNKDVNITGNRGIIYEKGNILYIDMYGAISDGEMKILTFKLKIENNKIFMRENSSFGGVSLCRVFNKSGKIPEDWKQYTADW